MWLKRLIEFTISYIIKTHLTDIISELSAIISKMMLLLCNGSLTKEKLRKILNFLTNLIYMRSALRCKREEMCNNVCEELALALYLNHMLSLQHELQKQQIQTPLHVIVTDMLSFHKRLQCHATIHGTEQDGRVVISPATKT
ncbi:unnamed protein product [Ceratitis capitata]|uniref:(Mediterranean fruit fly) hypothetical protein n=1 Tax=Ceratitis capitata TaxID=7213 RepID=A0A811V3U2_CERCA|nr:unnamed protein product [Ceratitis capitata]